MLKRTTSPLEDAETVQPSTKVAQRPSKFTASDKENLGSSGNKMMPSRKNEAARKTNRGRGRGRGGATRGGAVQKRQNSQKSSPNKAFRGGRGGTAPRLSEAAARQKLLQAKRTLQAAIK